MRLVEFFLQELIPLVAAWTRRPDSEEREQIAEYTRQAAEAGQAAIDHARSSVLDSALRKERVRAFEALGLARGIASGDFDLGDGSVLTTTTLVPSIRTRRSRRQPF